MRNILLAIALILAISTPTIPQTVRAYEDVFKRTTEIVKASRDTVMIAKLRAIGYQL